MTVVRGEGGSHGSVVDFMKGELDREVSVVGKRPLQMDVS